MSLPLSMNWQVQIIRGCPAEHWKELGTSGHSQLVLQTPILHNWERAQICRTHRSLKNETSIYQPQTTPTPLASPTPELQTPNFAGPIPGPGLLKLAVYQEALTQAVCSHPILVVPRILT